ELPRPMARGETLEFTSQRTMLETFSTKDGWFELTIDHPILQLSHGILFPKERPCQQAHLVVGEWERRLPVIDLAGGKTLVRYDQVQPEANTPYPIRWSWEREQAMGVRPVTLARDPPPSGDD